MGAERSSEWLEWGRGVRATSELAAEEEVVGMGVGPGDLQRLVALRS